MLRAGKPRGLLDGLIAFDVNCGTAEYSTGAPSNAIIDFSPRNNNLDIPTPQAVAPPALPVALPALPRSDIGSASKRSSEPQAWSLADSRVTKTRRQLDGLPIPKLPARRGAPVNEPVSGAGVLSAPAPRNSFVVRKEDRL